MNRYSQIVKVINAIKPEVLIEVGTNQAIRAQMMINAALQHVPHVEYIGFDLFEDATEETDKAELNAKPRITEEAAQAILRDMPLPEGKTHSVVLVKGNTRETLPPYVFPNPEKAVAFIDGGHSVETIRSDFETLKKAGVKVIVLDDYYLPDDKNHLGIDIKKFGCNTVLENEQAVVLPVHDPVREGGRVALAVIGWKPDKIAYVVKTRNCVPDETIQENVRHALSLNLREVTFCKVHNHVAVMCSGGPSLHTYIPRIKKLQEDGAYVFTCKTSHDHLLEQKIVPWGCLLLDPRAHVKNFIENPHPDVNYFVASMCHPTTFEKLISKGIKPWLYHAKVGAGEEQHIKQGFLYAGGPSASTRGLTLLYFQGFRRFEMFGYDNCYLAKPDMTLKDAEGRPKYIEVGIGDRLFWTDNERLAETQFFDKTVMPAMPGVTFNFHGDGMMAHVHQSRLQNVGRSYIEDIYG